jgi:aminoglycoside/choline kinase family phosphotransferase
VASTETYETLWGDPDWHGEARAWIEERLAADGRQIAGELEQPHLMQWATALRVPTSDGVAWFKACLPELAFERDVLALLSARRPDLVPRVVAADAERSWLLLDDAGERLRELESSPGQVERWANALARYAELQRAAAPDADAFAEAETIDRRGTLLFDQFAALLDHDYGLESDELARLQALRPKLEADAERLGELGLPDSIQHDDLHDANIFVRGDEYRIIDWGDSCVAHPFHSLAVALAVVEHRLGADAVEPVRAAYVDAWSVSATSEQLEAAFRLGYVSGTLKWHEVRNLVPDKTRDGFDDGLPLRLRRVLELCG